jgi:simple sugar transport system permease protein
MRNATATLVALALATFVMIGIVALFGISPAAAFETGVRGAFGNRFAIGETLMKSVPLLLTALSVAVSFRAGAWNIGAEGQFVVGGLAALVVATRVHAGAATALLALLAAAAAGCAWSSVAAWLKLRRNAPEVLTTILLNFVAIHALGYCVNGPLRETAGRYPQSDAIPASSALPQLGLGRLHAGALVGLAIAVMIWWLLHRTTAGLRLRATGLNARAARFAGIDVDREFFRAMALSGALAGVAGGIELLGVTMRLYERFAAGYGYSGIAVALLAHLHPLGAIASSVFFGAITTASGELQRATGMSAALAQLGQAVVILLLLIAVRRRQAPPPSTRHEAADAE